MKRLAILAGAFCLFSLLRVGPSAGGDGVKAPLLIGMPQSMLVDSGDAVDVVEEKLAKLMKEFTGLDGKLHIEKGPFELARQLEDKKVQLGVFQGIEFAWVQKKHPQLKPFMVAISDIKDKDKEHLRVLLIVREDSKAKDFGDLKGQTLSFPKKSKEHVRAYLTRNVPQAEKYFKAVVHSASVESGLDELVASKCDAIVADKTAVDFYRFLKPGAFRKLKVIQTSEPFPVGVVAYLQGALDAKTLERIEKGMLKANTSERGQDLMGTWGIAAFEEVFKSFEADLEATRKLYPAP
ncbi:MAG: PhnD/SsuA/transferrin family substrate-binding protein [Gemmataceae bacterium]